MLARKRTEGDCGRRRQQKRTPSGRRNVNLIEPDPLAQVSSASMDGAPSRRPTKAFRSYGEAAGAKRRSLVPVTKKVRSIEVMAIPYLEPFRLFLITRYLRTITTTHLSRCHHLKGHGLAILHALDLKEPLVFLGGCVLT